MQSYAPSQYASSQYAPSAPILEQSYSAQGQGFPSLQASAQVYHAPTVQQHEQTSALLDKANEIATSILEKKLHKNEESSNKSTYFFNLSNLFNFDFSDKSWNLFSSKKTEVHHHHYQADNKDNKEADKKEEAKKEQNNVALRIFIGLGALLTSGYTAYKLGKTAAEGEIEEDQVKSFESLKSLWNVNRNLYVYQYMSKVDEIAGEVDSILKRKKSDRIHKIGFLSSGLVSSGLVLGGAIANSQALIATGLGLGSIVAIAGVFKIGHSFFRKSHQDMAQSITHNVDVLKKQVYAVPVYS